ncbi:MAG: alpha/beta hydrolase [Candidatus Thorarchaeota archaeon]
MSLFSGNIEIEPHRQNRNMVDVEILPTEFTSEGETIRGNFVVPTGEGPFPGICKFHGLPGGPDQISGLATKLAEAGFVVLTFDFRGFRKSDGMFTLSGQIEDAKAAITHLLESDLTLDSWSGVYAASWGAAVAVCTLAHDKRPDVLCLRAPVYDTLWFAESPMIRPSVEFIIETDPTQIRGIDDPEIREDFLRRMVEDSKIHNPMNEISKISPMPLLIVHGTDDMGIPLAGVKRLYELAGEPKDLVVVEGADHNLSDPRAYEITMDTVVDWFLKQRNL